MRRILGFAAFLAAAAWDLRWEAIRAFLYDRGFHFMGLMEIDTWAHWGIPVALVICGCYLFWRTGNSGRSFLNWQRLRRRAPTPSAYCDLRELFGRLAPQLPLTASQTNGHTTIGTTNREWEAIGDEVLKQLSIGRLHAVGVGYQNLTRRKNAAPIPQSFWETAKFTYWFLDDDGNGILDAKNAQGVEYSDIEVDRAEASTIWPEEAWPKFKKWDQCKEFELYEAACLWFNLEPRLPMPERASARYNLWKAQIFGGGVPVNTESVRHAVEIGLRKEESITPHTKIDREILITIAEHEGARPLFLFPHKRGVPA